MDFDLAQTDALLSTTRSVRRRLDLDRPVDRALLEQCLELAIQAPTGGNAQSWRWLVIDDPAAKAAVGESYRRMAERFLPLYRRGVGPDPQTARVLDSAEYLAGVIGRAPVLVIPCIEGRLRDTSPMAAASTYGSILPAVWSFQLALRSRGLGSCFTTLHLADEETAAKVLGIPSDVTQVALLPVAYTRGTDFAPAVRRGIARITYWNRWNSTEPSAS